MFLILVVYSCQKNKVDYSSSNYPPEIAKIIVNKCAIAGCHNNASYANANANANGLNLSTWDNLFKGGNGGAAIIPYRLDESQFLLFCNSYADLGIVSPNIMPPIGNRLSRAEILTLQNWVLKGAPNKAGYVAFSENANRHKIYIYMQ